MSFISKNRKKAFRGLKSNETLTLQQIDKVGWWADAKTCGDEN